MSIRDSELLAARNQAIYQRYCYMYFTEMKREEVIWPVLKKEFWLEERTIYSIVLKVSREAATNKDQLELPLTEENAKEI